MREETVNNDNDITKTIKSHLIEGGKRLFTHDPFTNGTSVKC